MDPGRVRNADLRRIDVGARPDFVYDKISVTPAHVRQGHLCCVDVALLVLVHGHRAVLRQIGLEDLVHLEGFFL